MMEPFKSLKALIESRRRVYAKDISQVLRHEGTKNIRHGFRGLHGLEARESLEIEVAPPPGKR